MLDAMILQLHLYYGLYLYYEFYSLENFHRNYNLKTDVKNMNIFMTLNFSHCGN